MPQGTNMSLFEVQGHQDVIGSAVAETDKGVLTLQTAESMNSS